MYRADGKNESRINQEQNTESDRQFVPLTRQINSGSLLLQCLLAQAPVSPSDNFKDQPEPMLCLTEQPPFHRGSPRMSRICGPVMQNGYVVRDVDEAMAYWIGLGVGPFLVIPEMAFESFVCRGRQSDPRLKIAIASSGGLQIELIEQSHVKWLTQPAKRDRGQRRRHRPRMLGRHAGQLGCDQSWCQALDPDAVRSPGLPQRACEADRASFGCGISWVALVGPQARD